jgi:hypothetical protein
MRYHAAANLIGGIATPDAGASSSATSPPARSGRSAVLFALRLAGLFALPR